MIEQKENDVEKEEGNENIRNEVPFNPNDININIIPRTIGQLVDMLEYNEILVPKFQRLPNLWDLKKKSRFIESLMLSLPIPLFFFDEGDERGKKIWRVIDGLQRMSTLEQFILGNKLEGNSLSGKKEFFKLENLEFKTEFEGCFWKDLPKDMQRRITSNQVTINLIGRGTPEQVKYNIFSRINQGGIELKPQEIRTALFQGFRNDFIVNLVSDKTLAGKAFIKATNGSVSSGRQSDSDFATRFVSFYLLDYKTYKPDMEMFMTIGTNEIPDDSQKQKAIKESFIKSMELSIGIFGKNAFRKTTDKTKRKSINKPLFEIISVQFAKLTDIERANLLNKKEEFVDDFNKLQDNEDFWNSITTGTAAFNSVQERHKKFEELVNKYKNDTTFKN